jgi:glucan 1,3-beta-glucosidase
MRVRDPLTRMLGAVLILTCVVALTVALGLAFDPRYRDFPYAPLTAAIVPFLWLSLFRQRQGGGRAAAESTAAGILLLSAGYIVFNEGFANWQSLWFCVIILVLAFILLRARHARS